MNCIELYRNRMKKDFFSSKLCSFYNECITSAIYFPSISQENLLWFVQVSTDKPSTQSSSMSTCAHTHWNLHSNAMLIKINISLFSDSFEK